ncbi:galactosylceramide sulfotransferase-like [Diadema antillarum]|uniref:galactosylceramide sulfotransferase-like n=1 Tax=Diadema antillarum TaxID=105358 RepID=UPI003A84A34C
MRTKLRYLFLFGSAVILLCFVYLHSGLKHDHHLAGREDADSAMNRKLADRQDGRQDHIYHRGGNDFFDNAKKNNIPWVQVPDRKLDNGEDNEEESDKVSFDGKARARQRERMDDTLPRPDTGLQDHPMREKPKRKSKRKSKTSSKRKSLTAPEGDPIARFDWNQNVRKDDIHAPQRSLSSEKCTPKTNITFLKVHKTGSSTVQNIFLRYGDQNMLKFVLPTHGHHLGYPSFFEQKHMLKLPGGVYNIFCHHARFSNEVREVMPPNSVYISILRDPVKVFESAFTYFKLDMRMKMAGEKDAMKRFLDDPRKYFDEFSNGVHARNGMLYDFGVPQKEFDDFEFINRAISMINQQFDLVMIAEYFEESLILLKELLCWEMRDVVVFRQNARNVDSVQSVDLDMRSKIQDWNSGDMLLYSFFNKTLWEKIERYGHDRMKKDKVVLERKTKDMFKRCVATNTASRDQGDFKVWQPPGVNINAFVLKSEARGNKHCEMLVKPEIQYTMELKIKQFPGIGLASKVRQIKKPPAPSGLGRNW